MKDVVLSTRVPENIAVRLKELADAQEWTMSKYIEKLIRAHLEPRRGQK